MKRQTQRELVLEFWLIFVTVMLGMMTIIGLQAVRMHLETHKELTYYKSHYTLNTTEVQ